MAMRVIGSGFGRTGTLSLKLALEELGYGPCYHMEEVMGSAVDVNCLHDFAHGRPVDWHQLFKDYGSAVDFPASVVYKDLMEAYPDAKVVHTVRDSDPWYESTFDTIYQATKLIPRWIQRLVPVAGRWVDMVDIMVWDGLFDGRFEDRDFAIERYEAWTAEVIATVPPERLLVFEVADGWGPLCEFLGAIQPDGPFPRVNDREIMQQRFRRVRAITRAAPFIGVGAFAAFLATIRRLRRR